MTEAKNAWRNGAMTEAETLARAVLGGDSAATNKILEKVKADAEDLPSILFCFELLWKTIPGKNEHAGEMAWQAVKFYATQDNPKYERVASVLAILALHQPMYLSGACKLLKKIADYRLCFATALKLRNLADPKMFEFGK